MKRIGLISDTHGYMDDRILEHFKDCDEIWHAGDFGSMEVISALEAIKPMRGVWGNIDGKEIRARLSEELVFEIEGVKVFMIHIGGYPGRYPAILKEKLKKHAPHLFICGHSHILKVMPDKENHLLHINPGAAGQIGLHKIRTIIRFTVLKGKLADLEVIELGKRGEIIKKEKK